jgi:hypothetical protein
MSRSGPAAIGTRAHDLGSPPFFIVGGGSGYPRTTSSRSAARVRAHSRLAGLAFRFFRLKVRKVIDQRVRRSPSAYRS